MLLTAADLLIAQHRLIVSGPSHLQFPVEIPSHERSEPVRSPVPADQPRTDEPPMRTFPRLYRPRIEQSQQSHIVEFRSTTSPHRMHQIYDWESATLRPRYHLLANVRGLNTVFAIDRADYAALLAVCEQKWADGEAAESFPPELPQPLLDLLGADYVGKFDSGDAFRLARRPTALPRAWTVSHWEWLDDPPPKNFAQHRQRAEAVLFDRDGNVRDFRRMAVLERQDSGSFKPERSILQSDPSAMMPAERSELDAKATALEASEITWLRDLPERILLRVRSPHRRLLVLADQYDTDWQVHVSTSAGPSSRYRLWRANRVMRGVLLPAGDHLVEFRYRPRAVLVGAGLSLVGWLSVVGCLVVLWPRRRRLTNRLCGVDADRANL